ncbi:unnamed protein product [Chondrus crispus]|uniref:Uncharacterized protein n=1 Tax=Chondrus crispus TaxID=2769 RepID=R7Q476_CHOCR|nr:unnamed protein product [Chondrus crispus]CDF32673.1 unnamed protein product [Chondrus crispus]|eukprot:XP_005712444.1 unnamed protein product [Chondrus crispus]
MHQGKGGERWMWHEKRRRCAMYSGQRAGRGRAAGKGWEQVVRDVCQSGVASVAGQAQQVGCSQHNNVSGGRAELEMERAWAQEGGRRRGGEAEGRRGGEAERRRGGGVEGRRGGEAEGQRGGVAP